MKEKPEGKGQGFKLSELARLLDCPFEGNGEVLITGVAALDSAGPGDLVFWGDPRQRKALEETRASAAIIPTGESFDRLPVLRAASPHLVFVRATELFFSPYRPAPGVHKTAVVSHSAHIGRDVSIGPLTVVGDEAVIGDGVVLFPLVAVYPGVRIGAGTVVHSHVTLREDVRVGERVILHPGVVIGADGFGYIQDPEGRHRKVPQKGTVIIEDDVEVGANTTIDRAALGQTIVRRGTKIDNLVTVAHNVEVGPDTLLVAQTGIGGSSKIGANVIAAGQVGIPDHINIGDRVIIAAQTGVTKDVPSGSFVAGGTPHQDIREWRKFWAAAPQLYDALKELKKLKARVEELEKKLGENSPAEKS